MKIKIDYEHPYIDEKTIFELAEFYIDRALEWDDTPEYRQWKEIIDKGNWQTLCPQGLSATGEHTILPLKRFRPQCFIKRDEYMKIEYNYRKQDV